jgi:hypothetical protein
MSRRLGMIRVIRSKINNLIVEMLKVPTYKDAIKEGLSHVCHSGLSLNVLDIGGAGGKLWLDIKCPCIQLTIIDPWVPKENFEDPADSRLVGTFQEISPNLKSDSFDLVLAMDVIEHLSEADGYLLLYEMTRLSNNRVSIYTPNGFLWQPPSGNNSFNAHVSGWSVGKLKRFGFSEFRGHIGLRVFWGPYSVPKHSFESRKFVLASLVGNALIKLFPSLAFALSASADVKRFPEINDQGI